MSPRVEVKDFSFKYRDTKRRAVKHVDFQVEEGSFFTISSCIMCKYTF